MYDIDICMQIKNSFDNLAKDSSRCELSDLTIWKLLDIFSQTDTLNVVSNKKYLFRTINKIM